ncbi:unnamed protein product [Rotaria sp. Silwood2]|nr:unnamed protein product [Rotaria sp. Silwood2]
MQSVHKVFVSEELSDEERNLILIVRRAPGEPRAITNHDDLVKLVEKNILESKHNLQMYIFTAQGHVREHIKIWQKARIVVAPHGAGLFNVMWCKPGTDIIEIGYDEGWPMPEMYFEMASHCGHRYWLVKGTGKYSKPITADLVDLQWSIKQALKEA